jgi:hypothetical protein
MAQTNYTPISLYYSTTASAVPLAANLVNGELAININTADGKLYYKDSAGVVQTIASKATATLVGVANGGTGTTTPSLVAGTNVTITGTWPNQTINSSGGGGGVSSVTATSPVASSGGATPAISLNAAYGDTLNPYASKTANFVLAAPNGSSGVPTFRAIVAADIPTLNQNTTGTAAGLSTTLAVASGGTGAATFTANNVLLGNGTSAFQVVAPGTAGNVLTSDGTTWSSTTPAGGGVTQAKATMISFIFGI